MPRPLCLLCVHAHPDDEAIFTAGAMARYAAEGVRSVLVTCTDGSLGFTPDGSGPFDATHDRDVVAAARGAELEASASLLGVDRLVRLGYRDSGMQGWHHNDDPSVFVGQPLREVTDAIAAIIDAERPQVVITYDANGFYGHPDHITTHRATMAAVEATDVVDKVYFPAIPKLLLASFLELAVAAGMELPGWLDSPDWGTPDELVTTELDCATWVRTKHDAIAAHATQVDNADIVGMPDDLFDAVFSVERYVRAVDRTGAPVPETDLFAGIR